MLLDHYKKKLQGVHILLSAASMNGRSAVDLAQIAVDNGASVVQLREKEMQIEVLLPIANRMREICRDITFIVNDRADLAKIIDADSQVNATINNPSVNQTINEGSKIKILDCTYNLYLC